MVTVQFLLAMFPGFSIAWVQSLMSWLQLMLEIQCQRFFTHLCLTMPFKNCCLTFQLIKAFLRILYHLFLQVTFTSFNESCYYQSNVLLLFIYYNSPYDCLAMQALEISNSLPLHKIAQCIFRMKEIRAWQILKLFVSLFLKERIGPEQASVTLTVCKAIIESWWKDGTNTC